MNFVGRLLLALAVFAAQASLGMAVCACPEPSTPVAIDVATPQDVCPMSNLPGCKCCETEKPDGAKVESLPSDGPQAGAACEMRSDDRTDIGQLLNVSTVDVSPAILESEPLPQVQLPILELPVRPHLVVPRIRPPGFDAHGLRAPPSR